jgi:hypothetical protein
MKNLVFLLSLTLVSMGFTSKKMETPPATRYAYVTAMEYLDQSGKYVHLTTEVVSFNCEFDYDENGWIELQFYDHYDAYEKNSSRSINFSNAIARTYSSYDAAEQARRKHLADLYDVDKRTIYNFYITCND